MSAAVSSTTPHLDEDLNNNNNKATYYDAVAEEEHEIEVEEEDDDSKLESDRELDLGPQFTLKEQLEKDKDDQSLRKWKEKLLGSVDMSVVGLRESKDSEVKILSLIISSPNRPNLILPIPFTIDPKKSLFILKGGSQCSMKFTFTVSTTSSTLLFSSSIWSSFSPSRPFATLSATSSFPPPTPFF